MISSILETIQDPNSDNVVFVEHQSTTMPSKTDGSSKKSKSGSKLKKSKKRKGEDSEKEKKKSKKRGMVEIDPDGDEISEKSKPATVSVGGNSIETPVDEAPIPSTPKEDPPNDDLPHPVVVEVTASAPVPAAKPKPAVKPKTAANPKPAAPPQKKVSEGKLERSDSKSIVPPSYITKPLMSHSTHVHLPLVSSLLFQYTISITSETLGLTVENVLERTIIRTVIPNQSASLAGAQVGSLITMVGKRETRELTHFECIDELRQSKRPLSLTLRPVEENVLENGRR